MNNPPTFHGFAYSGETSDDDDPNDAYYYAAPPVPRQAMETFPYEASRKKQCHSQDPNPPVSLSPRMRVCITMNMCASI